LAIGGTLLAARLIGSSPRPLEIHPAPYDLNRADRAQLLQLPGVGPNLANRISAVRDERGGFEKVDDLRSVPGVGPARMERLRPLVRADAEAKAPDQKPAPAVVEHIDVNTAPLADLEKLEKLPGIGPKLAQRIIDERTKKPFASIDDLRRVSGIGPKTLEKLRPLVRVGPPAADEKR
jgi:competence protein ComEA